MKNSPVIPCNDCFTRTDSVFRHLSPEELESISINRDSKFFKKGHTIYHEGNRINGSYCILKGIIKIYKTGSEGKEQIIKFATAGDIIGFRSVLSNELACTSAEVLEDSQVCYISSDTLISLIKTNGNFSLDIIRLACKELDEANEYLTDIAQKTVRERLAEILLKLDKTFSSDNTGFLQITLTREDLANMVGTATESVIRLLSEFKQEKLIDLQGKKIKLLNIPSLLKISNI